MPRSSSLAAFAGLITFAAPAFAGYPCCGHYSYTYRVHGVGWGGMPVQQAAFGGYGVPSAFGAYAAPSAFSFGAFSVGPTFGASAVMPSAFGFGVVPGASAFIVQNPNVGAGGGGGSTGVGSADDVVNRITNNIKSQLEEIKQNQVKILEELKKLPHTAKSATPGDGGIKQNPTTDATSETKNHYAALDASLGELARLRQRALERVRAREAVSPNGPVVAAGR